MTVTTDAMTTVAVTDVQQFTRLKVPIPDYGPDEVLVRVAYCGICGSDVPRFFNGAVHSFPQVLGHEFSGVIAAVGRDVTHLQPGQSVAVAPLVPCHHCGQCDSGHPSLCPDYSFIGSRQQGALADYVAVPAVNVVPVGDMSLQMAALIEPLTVAIHAINQVSVSPDHAMIFGGGMLGIMSVMALRERGVRCITVVDINPWVLDMATRFGATYTVHSPSVDIGDHVAKVGAPDLVLETAGATATRQAALETVAKNGAVVYVGTPSQDLTLPPATFEAILRKELTIRGSWMSYSAPFPGAEWQEAQRILGQAIDDPHHLITHMFDLDEVEAGFAVMADRDSHRLKVMFRVAGEEAR